MYKIENNMTPSYIDDLIPPTVRDISNYPLRNQNNISSIATRTNLFQKSCIPSAIELWNSIDLSLRDISTLTSFKHKIKQPFNEKVPTYYLNGNRYLSVIHARIRNNCSNLNGDLYNNHLRDDPYCACNNNVFECASHYFFSCPKYREQRLSLFRQTREFHPLNINLLQT
jgi:hypothetical protein